MAWSTLREHGALRLEPEAAPRSARQVIKSGILINILTPKLSIFFFAFLPQFVSTRDADALPRMLGLSGVFMLATFVVFAIYGVFAAALRRHILGRPRAIAWLRRMFAAAFVALGIRLAFAKR